MGHNLIKQLPKSFYILGDFNAHHALWGSEDNNSKGNTVEDFLLKSNICLLNDNSPTHYDIQTGKTSNIDLSLCSPTLVADSIWSTITDPHQSDHYPISIKIDFPTTQPLPERFNFKKRRLGKLQQRMLTKTQQLPQHI